MENVCQSAPAGPRSLLFVATLPLEEDAQDGKYLPISQTEMHFVV